MKINLQWLFAALGAWFLIASAVAIAGGPCLAWEGSIPCSFGKRN